MELNFSKLLRSHRPAGRLLLLLLLLLQIL
jgi:hypothetical protein